MKPKISVVIPAWDEEKLLPDCFKSLEAQTYPKDQFEIILVDNGSTDKTVDIARKYGARVFFYTQIHEISATKRFGAAQAKGDIIAFTDADSIVAADWLEKIDRLLAEPRIVCIGGQIMPINKSFWQTFIYGFYNNFHIINNAIGKPIMWGLNMAVKREAYEKVGGLNGNLPASEDWDLAFRLQKEYGKGSVLYLPDLKVATSTRKQGNLAVFLLYVKNGFFNYTDFVIFGKTKAKPAFHVR